MTTLLGGVANFLCRALKQLLPGLSQSWWQDLVMAKLSFQQRQHAERRQMLRLDDLDLSALLRVTDQNWHELADHYRWPYDARNYVKETQTVRNRWAHAGVTDPSPEDVYRDLDTVQRFISIFAPADPLIGQVQASKKAFLGGPTNSAPEQSRTEQNPAVSKFPVGHIVRLKADPTKCGAVTAVAVGGKENLYQVFHDGKVASFYESQLLPQDTTCATTTVIPLDAFRARLTALQLLHPSISNLYSLHAARIDVVPYQFRPVWKFIQSDRPRLLIADSVGVGKTIEAGLILRELQARRDIRRVLIACPRPLVTEEKWRREMKRFDERFEHLDGPKLRFCISETDLDGEWPQQYEKVIIPFSLLTNDILHGQGKRKGLIQLDPPPQFDLVIVDEAHHIRNTETQMHQAIRFFCDNAEAVVFLTATPIQLSDHDLFVLLNTLRPDVIIDEAGYTAITEPNVHINEAVLIARKGTPGWTEEARAALLRASETPWGKTVLQRDPCFQDVFDSLRDFGQDRSARVEAIRIIERQHTLSGVMNRTLRRDIGEFTQRKPETVSVDFTPEQRRLHDAVLAAQASIYATLHGDRSVNFLLTTIRRQTASCIYGLAPLLRGILSRRMDELEWDEVSELSDEAEDVEGGVLRIKSLVDKALRLAEQLDPNPDRDPKFTALRKILDQKQLLPNNKIMLFSSFRHTLTYLHNALVAGDYRVGLIHGGVNDEARMALRSRFEKDRTDPEALDVLLFSEIGCEGLDYQFCDCIVNYDIPWNPMRIDQRIGRIDRWGQQSEAVAIYNLITPCTIDAEIYERCLMRIGVFERALGANEAILGKITQEITSVAENLSLTEKERRERLDQLADNSIRLVKEQQDLESRQTEIFGLRVPQDQFREDMEKATSYWLSAQSLERLAVLYLRSHTGKDDSPLLGEGPKKLLRLSRATRDALLQDFNALQNRTCTLAREWELWLKGNDPHLAVTFDPAFASEDRKTCLITPVHRLVLQSARTMAALEHGTIVTAIQVNTDAVPPGDYPFAIYQWQYHGIRNDVEFQPVAAEPRLTEQFFFLMPTAQGIDIAANPVNDEMHAQLEHQHYRVWSDARAQHIEQTMRVAGFRRGSLETSHKARMAILDAQLTRAENDRIRIMKTAQKANAQADYERRLKEIEEATSRSDITAQPVGWGIIRVRG
ncbi:MAG: DEAD/DEAH box helicase family protein [Verrucomicrobia bacterium]|nr:DEAD/DEAH box helicase family protein [Verrucomicrobiota bacterium]